MPKILFIAAHRPNRSPSQRFRFEQYLDYLRQNDFDYEFSFLLSEEDDKIFYSKGHYLRKIIILLKSALKRWRDTEKAKHVDIVFVQREAFMTGSVFFEKRLKKSKAKFVFDFDDAIWHHDISDANKKFSFLKRPDKTSEIIALADIVFAGNTYLADYAKQFNENVVIIPTTIDTDEYQKISIEKSEGRICIGWSGSITTIKHFEFALPFLIGLRKKYGEKIAIKVIGDSSYFNEQLNVRGISWIRMDEIKELSEIDIGIMPLPDDEWTQGKCGLKGLQYMALEIPTVMSKIGVNTEIILDGENGFLASSEEEWINKISQLIESAELRTKLGQNARRAVKERYSVNAQKNNYLNYFNDLLK